MGRTVQAIMNMIEDSVKDGTLDYDNLSELGSHVYDWRSEVQRADGRKVAAMLMRGSKVRIKHDAHLRPRYILGTEAEVVKINKTTATIILGEIRGGSGRFETGQEIRCPLDALELMEGV